MNKIFVDTDAILDLLAERIPHFHFSAVLFTFAEMKKLELYTSPLILANTFYVLRKQIGIDGAKNALRKLRILLHVVDSSESVVDKALNSEFADFEDAIQYYTALEHGISVILTRNLRDYKNASVIVQTPETFLVTNGLI
ncbi:MAG: PIN domain-containing protein [Treponemataceae bacterium]|nr:PIN domain-containing protein [Treponemataceae bacterium]